MTLLFSPAGEHPLSDSVPGCHKKRFAKQDYPTSQGADAPKKRAANLSTRPQSNDEESQFQSRRKRYVHAWGYPQKAVQKQATAHPN